MFVDLKNCTPEAKWEQICLVVHPCQHYSFVLTSMAHCFQSHVCSFSHIYRMISLQIGWHISIYLLVCQSVCISSLFPNKGSFSVFHNFEFLLFKIFWCRNINLSLVHARHLLNPLCCISRPTVKSSLMNLFIYSRLINYALLKFFIEVSKMCRILNGSDWTSSGFDTY